MCFLVFFSAPIYLAIVSITILVVCRDDARRRIYLVASTVSLVMTAVVAWIGVPYTRDSTRMPALYVGIVLLALGPFVLPRMSRGARRGLVAAAIAVFVPPVLWVEYLTFRHGGELQAAYDAKRSTAATNQRLFSVFEYSSDEATVLRVEGTRRTMGYFLRFRREDGAWEFSDPQAVLWSDAGSAFIACPYPTSVLLLLHGVMSIKC